MKHPIALALALAAAPLLLALDRRVDPVSFHPADGSSLAKEFTIELDLSVGDMVMAVDGMDMSSQIPGDMGFTVEFVMEVVDEYVKTVEGRPHELIRSFESLEGLWEGSGGGNSDSGEVEGFADLEDHKVRFVWDAEEGEYTKSYHESEGDDELLDALNVDMDMRALLPAGEVDVGDTWEVSADEVGTVFFFGANLDDMGPDDADEMLTQMIEDEILPQLTSLGDELSFRCEYKDQRDVDGVSMAAIALTIEGDGDIDLTGAIEAAIAAQVPAEVDMDMSISTASLSLTMDGTGELLWNQRAGLFQSFSMNASIEIQVDVAIDVDAEGESHSMEANVELLGDGVWSAVAGG